MMRTSLLRLAAVASLAALPAIAQDRPAAMPTLAARMDAFLLQSPWEPADSVAAFFPRRGDWTWVQTWRANGRTAGGGTWRFSAAETARAIGAGGAACRSFQGSGGEIGPVLGLLAAHAQAHPAGWRRVAGSRFVPPGASGGSPVFVEWRREDGRWVVAGFGDAQERVPRVLGVEAGTVARDTSLVPEGAAYAAGMDWYETGEPVTLGGLHYVKYALPRVFPESDRRHLERIGVAGRVSVYMEAAAAPAEAVPEVLYLPVAPGEFQAYTGFGNVPCDWVQR
ncbi:MAG TPA: hypothetical protein VE871_19610 [Longimicrobium sp.]|nr:hypothetical protein [Longimicrobium sp.]